MLAKRQEMMEKQRQLEEIEKQTGTSGVLGVKYIPHFLLCGVSALRISDLSVFLASATRVRPMKRVPEDAREPSGIIAKRLRDRST